MSTADMPGSRLGTDLSGFSYFRRNLYVSEDLVKFLLHPGGRLSEFWHLGNFGKACRVACPLSVLPESPPNMHRLTCKADADNSDVVWQEAEEGGSAAAEVQGDNCYQSGPPGSRGGPRLETGPLRGESLLPSTSSSMAGFTPRDNCKTSKHGGH